LLSVVGLNSTIEITSRNNDSEMISEIQDGLGSEEDGVIGRMSI